MHPKGQLSRCNVVNAIKQIALLESFDQVVLPDTFTRARRIQEIPIQG